MLRRHRGLTQRCNSRGRRRPCLQRWTARTGCIRHLCKQMSKPSNLQRLTMRHRQYWRQTRARCPPLLLLGKRYSGCVMLQGDCPLRRLLQCQLTAHSRRRRGLRRRAGPLPTSSRDRSAQLRCHLLRSRLRRRRRPSRSPGRHLRRSSTPCGTSCLRCAVCFRLQRGPADRQPGCYTASTPQCYFLPTHHLHVSSARVSLAPIHPGNRQATSSLICDSCDLQQAAKGAVKLKRLVPPHVKAAQSRRTPAIAADFLVVYLSIAVQTLRWFQVAHHVVCSMCLQQPD